MEKHSTLPPGVKILAGVLILFGLFAFFGSLFMWGEGFLFSFPPGVDYSFPITDILVNAPACIITAIGLWQGERYGYIAAQFTAGFFVYASVEIFVMVFQEPPPYPLEILIPQVMAMVVAYFLVFYLWRIQGLFQK
jgi:hypothetical protein